MADATAKSSRAFATESYREFPIVSDFLFNSSLLTIRHGTSAAASLSA